MENNLEDYFAELGAELRDLPDARRAEFVAEARAHLAAMIEARRADGLSDETARRTAMAEFGKANKIGRALYKQWASRGQLENEGAPLSRAELTFKWLFPTTMALFTCLMLWWGWGTGEISFSLTLALLVMFFGTTNLNQFRSIRIKGERSPLMKLDYAFYSFCLAVISTCTLWEGTLVGELRNYLIFAALSTYLPLSLWFRKQEIGNRPWQFDKRFLQSPIAAEQSYRLEPTIVLVTGTPVTCAAIVTLGLGSSSLPIVLLACAGVIGAAIIFGRWLVR